MGSQIQWMDGEHEWTRNASRIASRVVGGFQHTAEQRQNLEFQGIHGLAHYRLLNDRTVWLPFSARSETLMRAASCCETSRPELSWLTSCCRLLTRLPATRVFLDATRWIQGLP